MKALQLRILRGHRAVAERPVTVGVPLPIGLASPDRRWAVSFDGHPLSPVQSEPLVMWPDGSVKWLLTIFEVPRLANETETVELRPVSVADGSEPEQGSRREIRAQAEGDCVYLEAERRQLRIARGQDQLLLETGTEFPQWLGPAGCRLLFTDESGHSGAARIDSLELEQPGPLRVQVAFGGRLGRTGLRFSGDLCCFSGARLCRLRITVENPRRARHPGGYWDLGDPGSVLLRDLSIEVETRGVANRRVGCLAEIEGQPLTTDGERLEIYQDSSGGEHWRSHNHLNRNGEIPLDFRGYRVRSREGESRGLRASPVVSLAWPDHSVSLAMEEFWQQFPSALEVHDERVVARLFPAQFGDLHELQGGEHNTRVLWIEFGSGEHTAACQRLAWVHQPPIGLSEPAWTAASCVLPFFPSPAAKHDPVLESIWAGALNGEHSFFAKREAIDEFGWRNFGDMWADHEEVYACDPVPVASHYNNQYDLLHSLLVHYLMTGDRRWWQLADPLARHLMDIDLYHTDRDKPAYNGGLFWHTAHYHDAGRSTHRSMSKDMVGRGIPALGGGPGNEHNYSAGLSLYHHLTGCRRARLSVISLAEWVLAMDDGRRHALGILSARATGDASRTAAPSYHGPGRGVGNSINALLDAWLLTGRVEFMEKLDELIRRSIHPGDAVESMELDNAELRWSYTVSLQALVRFLELTEVFSGLDLLRAYVQAALLRYSRWMADHEDFYLDEPAKLEYPTETWAAAELIKGTTLLMTSRYASGNDRERFNKKAEETLSLAWQSLLSFESRFFTRPLALALQQGYLESCLTAEEAAQDKVSWTHDGLEPEIDYRRGGDFVDQRLYVRGFPSSPWRLLGIVTHATRPSRWLNMFRQSWVCERLRRSNDALGWHRSRSWEERMDGR